MNFNAFTTKTIDETYAALKTDAQGLRAKTAERRLDEYGPNELERERVQWHRVLLRQFQSPFFYVLALAAAIAFALGEMVNAAMIVAFVAINAALGFGQEYQSERAVEMLRSFVKAKSRVRRDGKEELVDSRDLVPGDVVIVETGDLIHADIRFVEDEQVLVDESVLTGESIQVAKSAKPMAVETKEAYKATNIGFARTAVVSGRGVGVVIATGNRTQIGDIGRLTAQTNGESGFQKDLGRFSVFILRTIVVTLIVVFAANVLSKGSGVNIPDLLIFSIALAVSVIPEALPVVITTTFSRGAMRLARKKVVIKRLSAIEDLGSIDVLCTDKTGTITENKMEVAEVHAKDREECLYLAAVASAFLGERRKTPNNAFDMAIWDTLTEAARERVRGEKRSHEVPFDPARRYNSVVVGNRTVVRGALEEVMALCEEPKAESQESKSLTAWVKDQGEKGRRVLAIAADRKLIGAVAFEDPIKKTAKRALAHAKQLGVAVKILTGDSAEVAGAVAMKVGLIKTDDEVMTGEQWEALLPGERLAAVREVTVFARVSPQQKFLIIHLLHEHLEVGFLGEGINDAPALKIAQVGIVVDGAADIAREAADIVLMQHSLEVIIDGIREGREVFANTVKYIKATLASNFGNFLAIATAALLVDYFPMLPVQILLVNLLSDFPMIAIATDTVDVDELKRPRSYDLRDIILAATVLGVVSTAFDFIFFGLFSRISPEVLQTNWFIGSILTELVLIFSIRTRLPFWKAARPSPILFWLSLIAAVATISIPFTRFGETIFSFVRPTGATILLILGIVAVYFVVTEIVKLSYCKRSKTEQWAEHGSRG